MTYEIVQQSPIIVYRRVYDNPVENNIKNEYFYQTKDGKLMGPFSSIPATIEAAQKDK